MENSANVNNFDDLKKILSGNGVLAEAIRRLERHPCGHRFIGPQCYGCYPKCIDYERYDDGPEEEMLLDLEDRE